MTQVSDITVLFLSVFAAIGMFVTIIKAAQGIMWLAKYKDTIEAYAKMQKTLQQ